MIIFLKSLPPRLIEWPLINGICALCWIWGRMKGRSVLIRRNQSRPMREGNGGGDCKGEGDLWWMMMYRQYRSEPREGRREDSREDWMMSDEGAGDGGRGKILTRCRCDVKMQCRKRRRRCKDRVKVRRSTRGMSNLSSIPWSVHRQGGWMRSAQSWHLMWCPLPCHRWRIRRSLPRWKCRCPSSLTF